MDAVRRAIERIAAIEPSFGNATLRTCDVTGITPAMPMTDRETLDGARLRAQTVTKGLTPPFLAIEILSRTDRASDVEEKIDDYLSFGVSFVWVIDPRLKLGYVYTNGGRETCSESLSTVGPEIRVLLADPFA